MAEERKLDPHFVELSKAFRPGEYTDDAGNRIWYRLFTPALEEKKEYPLVVFLHGSGERGEACVFFCLGRIKPHICGAQNDGASRVLRRSERRKKLT